MELTYKLPKTTISKGSSYKGGKEFIQTSMDGIHVAKQYYMDGVHQDYNIKKNITKRTIYIFMRRGKWVKKYIHNIAQGNIHDERIDIKIPSKIMHDVSDLRCLGVIQNFKKSNIDIRPYGDVIFIINSESKGLKFIDNFESINILKDYRKFLSHILNTFKNKINLDNEIKHHITDDKDMNTKTININLKQIV